MLSCTFKTTFPLILSSNKVFSGKGFIFGPLTTSTSSVSSTGLIIIESSIINLSIFSLSNLIFILLGSVNSPLRADTAATSGLTRYT